MPTRDRRTDIMRAAEKLFTSRRFHEITLDDIVAEAKVGKGTVYRYFQDKDDLFFQTATRGFDELCDLLRQVPADGSFEQQLLGMCRQISGFFRGRMQMLRLMQTEEGRVPWLDPRHRRRWTEHRRELIDSVGSVLRRGQEQGRLRREVNGEVLAAMLLGMLRTRARDLGDVPDEDRPLELVVDLFCHGAGAENASIVMNAKGDVA